MWQRGISILVALKPVEPTEKELQTMIEKDVGCLEDGLLYVDHFVTVGTGIIDTLAIDSKNNPVVIEYKVQKEEDEMALLQAMSYASWVDKNPDSVLRFVHEKRSDIKVESLGDTRIMLVAPSFTDRTKQAVIMVEPEITLKRYLLFDVPSVGRQPYFETIYDSRTWRPESKPTAYSIDEHFEGKYSKMKPVFNHLVTGVKKFGQDVSIEPRKWYIAFRKTYNFAVINIYMNKLEVGLPLPSPDQDSRMMDISNWGFSRILYGIVIKDDSDIDDRLLKWLRAAYDSS